MTIGVGFGFTVTFGTSSYSTKCRVASRTGAGRDKIDTSHSETTDGWETSVPGGIQRAGNLRIQGLLQPQTSPDPPIDQAAETITLTYPNGATLAGSGYMTDYEENIPYDDVMTFAATIVWTGALTHTPAA